MLGGDFCSSLLLEAELLVVEAGLEVTLSLVVVDSSESVRASALGGGLASTGVRALR